MSKTTVPTPADFAAFLHSKYVGEQQTEAKVENNAQESGEAQQEEHESKTEADDKDSSAEGKPREKPWGENNPYDEVRAWNLIENLRQENSRLKAERAEQMKYVQPTDSERELRERLAQVEAQLLDAERSKALVEAGLPTDLISLVTAKDTAGIKQQIQLLTSLRGQSLPTPAGKLPAFTNPTLTNTPAENATLGEKLRDFLGD